MRTKMDGSILPKGGRNIARTARMIAAIQDAIANLRFMAHLLFVSNNLEGEDAIGLGSVRVELDVAVESTHWTDVNLPYTL